jgi:splicing factor 3B subunit 3
VTTRLQFVHKTEVGDVPYVITPFPLYGKVLIGVGNTVRIYDLGKKKLLKKCETKVGG